MQAQSLFSTRLLPGSLVPNRRLRELVALLAGAALAMAFAPFNVWPFALLSPAVLIWLWEGAKPREGAWLGFWFSAGTFAAGTYWLYISIHVFGQAALWIAFGLMAALVAIMAAYHALLGYLVARWFPSSGPLRWMVAIPAAWVLMEWWRGWFASGFAWLSLGYSQTDTWLGGYAPVLGVYGISTLLLLSAGCVVTAVLGSTRARATAVAALATVWGAGAALLGAEWTHPSGAPVSVAIVQGAISQDLKWLEENRDTTLALYRKLNTQALGASVIVWPESALPDLANNLLPYLRDVYSEAHAQGSTVIMGLVRADQTPDTYFNSVLGLGENVQWYDKHHLVPFAEFFPVPSFVRSWMKLNSLPYTDFTPGADYQPPLKAGKLSLSATICYEDAYGSSQLDSLRTADGLVNVTNDAWFGRSTARHQHFQIARMRAMEAERFMLRAANDGISGVIGPHGEVVARAVEFQPYVLKAEITPRLGLPPYARVGNWLIVSLATTALAFALTRYRLARRRTSVAAAGTAAAQVR